MLSGGAQRHRAIFGLVRQSFSSEPQNAVGLPGWWRAFHSSTSVEKLMVLYPRPQSPHEVQEALQLAETYSGEKCEAHAAGSARGFVHNPGTFFGSGAVEHVKSACEASKFERVFVNANLSAIQLRNLEAAWQLPVLDRIGLIIEIFAQRARTREARLQVEMAALRYKATRLVRAVDSKSGARKGFGSGFETEVVSARQRGRSSASAGGLGGAAGGGETELQLQRRRIQNRIKALQRKLEEVRRTREMQRLRRRRAGNPIVGIVGYTSAGKSSLLTALSHKYLSADERLFETLDPTWASIYLPSGRAALASDTVGFISDLPHSLVSAFQATLEEVTEADVLLHVLDASSPNVAAQRQTVYEVLRRLRIPEQRLQDKLIEVWNKSDLVQPACPAQQQLEPSTTSGDSSVTWRESRDTGAAAQSELAEERSSDGVDVSEESRSCASLNGRGDNRVVNSGRGESEELPGNTNKDSDDGNSECRESTWSTELLDDAVDEAFEAQQKDAVWNIIGKIREQQGELRPRALVTSTLTRQGLPTLLEEIDKLVSLRSAIEELKFSCARAGPRLLSENVVGPPMKNSELRKAMKRRMPNVQPIREEHARRLAIWKS